MNSEVLVWRHWHKNLGAGYEALDSLHQIWIRNLLFRCEKEPARSQSTLKRGIFTHEQALSMFLSLRPHSWLSSPVVLLDIKGRGQSLKHPHDQVTFIKWNIWYSGHWTRIHVLKGWSTEYNERRPCRHFKLQVAHRLDLKCSSRYHNFCFSPIHAESCSRDGRAEENPSGR